MTTIKEKALGLQKFHAELPKGKAHSRTHLFWLQGQCFFHFNEVSPLLGTSNLISCSALFYLMFSALWFKLKVYLTVLFFWIYPNDFWSINNRQFYLAFFLYSVFCLPTFGNIHHRVSKSNIDLHGPHNFWPEVLGSPYL